MIRRWIFTLLLLASGSALGQTYALHQQFLGIYWNPALAGNGFSIDIQNGQLFGAIFSFKDSGADGFLTLYAASPVNNNDFRFRGDVFLTDNAGSRTRDMGNFDLRLVTIIGQPGGGQPGLVLDMSSPYLDLDEQLLIRFGYTDIDELGPIAGKLWGITFTTGGSLTVLDFIGGFFLVGNERFNSDGQLTLAVTTGSASNTGVAFYDPDSGQFLIGIDVSSTGDFLLFEGISSHSDMFGTVSVFRDNQLTDQRSYVGTAAASTVEPTKSLPPVSAARVRELSRLTEPVTPMPPVVDIGLFVD